MNKFADKLASGIIYPDRTGSLILYRFLRATDSLAEITQLLHAGYAKLAELGMRFVASHQNEQTTKERLSARGETILALDGSQIIGTVTLADIDQTDGSPYYDRPDVASFGQFAVLPERQSAGIGRKLLELVEARAHEKGVSELGLDTAETATHLIAWYAKCGFRFVECVQWDVTNYRSVVMGKSLRKP